jgi:B12 binding domain
VFPDWTKPLLVLALFVTLEPLIAFVVEPLIYGQGVGVSDFGLLVAVAFWTWMWGPIGLIMSTPLTVCLVVLGRHVPTLEFIAVLMGDEPGVTAEITYYQRLLARDTDEALQIVEDCLKDHPREEVFDDVLVPALSLARRDCDRGELTVDDERFILTATRELLEHLEREQPQATRGQTLSKAHARPTVVGCPARGEAEMIGLTMLRTLVDPHYEVQVASTAMLASEIMELVDRVNPTTVCIGSLEPGGIAETRYLCKRLRGRFPAIHIVVGRWGGKAVPPSVREVLATAGADAIGATVRETRDALSPFVQLHEIR